MTKPKLEIIEGGLPFLIKNREKHLVSSYITDTRLMGVLVLYARWRFIDTDEDSDLHQFFYIDCEDSGLETYRSLSGINPDDITIVDQALTGGLGGKKIEITQKQLSYVLTYYKRFNEENNIELPKGLEEYSFLLNSPHLTEKEQYELMEVISGPVKTTYQTINYFLMRYFGHDYEGAKYLCDPSLALSLNEKYISAVFCRNVIDDAGTHGDGSCSYLCESLVKVNEIYEVVISKITIRNLKVTYHKISSSFPVSSIEASIILAKPEYITVYDMALSDEDLGKNINELVLNYNTIMSPQENGTMFMIFKYNNEHVNSQEFRLNNDVRGILFLTNYGQLIALSYNLPDIRYLERKIKESSLAPHTILTSKYQFKDPVLLEFIQSEFEDFDDFVEAIKDE